MAQQMNNKIFWIASYPCSGNTWLRLFLLNLLAETGLAGQKNVGFDDLEGLIPWDVHCVFYKEVTGKDVSELSPAELCAARLDVHKLLLAKSGGNLFAKTHAANGLVNGQPSFAAELIWGAAYMVRNPLDVAVAMAKRLNVSQEQAVRVMNTPGYVHIGG